MAGSEKPSVSVEDLEGALQSLEVNRISEREQKLGELAARLTPQQRSWADNWGLGKMSPRDAMRAAKYSEETIDHKGPAVLFRSKNVMAYVEALCDQRVETVVDVIKAQLMGLENALPVALNTLVVLAGSAQNENVRAKAAGIIVDLCKGILIATLPKKSVDFTSLMRSIYDDAKKDREKDMKTPVIQSGIERYLEVESEPAPSETEDVS